MIGRMKNASLIAALAVSKGLQNYDEVRDIQPEYEVPKFLRQSPDGRTLRQSEKRAQKQAMKDRRRAFRHSVDKQNKIAKAVDVRNKPQQARMSEIDDD